jgi:hypothetical protein
MIKELTINPKSLHFTMSQEERFKKVLEDIDRHSIMYPIGAKDDVLLDDQAEVGSGDVKLKYTTLALYQLCQALCPGLFGFIRELSGVNRTIKDARSDFSQAEAIDVLNKVIRRRFDTRLKGRILLKNNLEHTIDGILSPRYKWLPNLRLYEHTKQAMAQRRLPTEFYEAGIHGRWMYLRYYQRKCYFSLELPNQERDKFYAGFHFSNDELGRAAVRGAPVIMRGEGRSAAMGKIPRGEYLRHVGKAFDERFNKLVELAIQQLKMPKIYADRIAIIREQPLGFGGKTEDEELKIRRILADKLDSPSLPIAITKRIVHSMCAHQKWDLRHKALDPMFSERTVYDLYNAIGREARVLPIRFREAAEQLAYSILMGTVKF